MTLQFPPGFLWGAATSAYQVEGENPNNDWSDWEKVPGRIYDGSRAGDACGWWSGRAEEDLALARRLGQTAHRLGFEWSRIEPEQDRVDDAALERYEEILLSIRNLGMTPMVTLHHFSLPRWIAQKGGWLNERTPELFARFAERCVSKFGDLVTLWVTINEPSMQIFQGYFIGAWPRCKHRREEGPHR